MNRIGTNIRKMRLEKKMSQEDLAIRVFTTRQTISNYENGKSNPDVDMLKSIAEALDVDTSQLIYGNAAAEKKRGAWIAFGAILAVFFINLFLILYLEEIGFKLSLINGNDGWYIYTSRRLLLRHCILGLVLFALGWTATRLIYCYLPVKEKVFHHKPIFAWTGITLTVLFSITAGIQSMTWNRKEPYGLLGERVLNIMFVFFDNPWLMLIFILIGGASYVTLYNDKDLMMTM